MPKACAYCGGPPPFTREHIWPSGFLKRGKFEIKFSARANKTFEGDLIIADVCATCNNGPLGKLDAHACELYDRRFGKRVEAGERVAFTYDYALFMRWLLKVSFNSSRTTGNDTDLLSRYRGTIINDDPCSPVWVAAKVATISPSLMVNPVTGETRKIYPLAARCGPMQVSGLDISDQAALRCIMINSFYFSLVITRGTRISRNGENRMSKALAYLPGRPLSYGGHMRVGPPSLPAHVALGGIEEWPRLEERG